MSEIRFKDPTGVSDKHLSQLFSYERLSAKEAKRLVVRYQDLKDESARARVIMCHQRLVMSIVKKFPRRQSLEVADLMGYGNAGLMDAIEKFDRKEKAAFATYATYWVAHEIRRSLEDLSRTVRIPVEQQARFRRGQKLSAPLGLVHHTSIDALTMDGVDRRSQDAVDFLSVIPEETVDLVKMGTILSAPETWGLTESEADIFRMHFVDEMKYTEIGVHYGKSREWARLEIVRIVSHLQARLGLAKAA